MEFQGQEWVKNAEEEIETLECTCSKLNVGVSVVSAKKVLLAQIAPVDQSEVDAAVGHGR